MKKATNRWLEAEGTGLEPATHFWAIDFESTSSPFGYPPHARYFYLIGLCYDKVAQNWEYVRHIPMIRSQGRRIVSHGAVAALWQSWLHGELGMA